MIQGQSAQTRFKEFRFVPIMGQSLGISKAPSVAWAPYYHIDLNSGNGYNDEVSVQGSPLNFLEAVERHNRLNFHAFFIDHNREAILTLLQRPEIQKYNGRQVSLHIGDNSEMLPVVAAFIASKEKNPHYAIGSILIDPNGWRDGVPWEALRVFCKTHPRMDVIMNLNVSWFKRVLGCVRKGISPWHRAISGKGSTGPYPSEFPALFSRNHWMLTEQDSSGGYVWVQLVGRSMQTRSAGYESIGFYDYHSERGQQIIHEIETLGDPTPPSIEHSLFDE